MALSSRGKYVKPASDVWSFTATRQNHADEGTVEKLCAEIRNFEATQAKP